ncbi:hypothetical protein B0J17DRAFT_751019 [Rhizoctonia solani]|nr:hypothetical protein B0J17DRAFT_751019 [Rhizoctonia solani]
MKNFTLPDNPLLDEAAASSPDSMRSSPEPHGEDAASRNQGHDGSNDKQPEQLHTGSDEDDANVTNTHKRPRLTYQANNQAGNNGNQAHLGLFVPWGNAIALPTHVSLHQYAPGLASSKKLSDNSVQELHRFATSSAPERDMMAFALNLELRDILKTISKAVVSTNVHPDLRKHIKTYTAALFFSPALPYYSAPRGGTRNKELPRTVLRMLNSCQVANIPPPSNHAATEKLGKRKQGASGMDLGSFVASLTRNTTIKVTKEHYGRVAFLSREYRRWDSRDATAGGELTTIGFWDWVDKALDQARKKYGKQPAAINRYFQSVIEEDEKLFSKAVGKVVSSEERDDWQRQIEAASSLLPIANS